MEEPLEVRGGGGTNNDYLSNLLGIYWLRLGEGGGGGG